MSSQNSPDAVVVDVKVLEEAADVSAGDGAAQSGQAHCVAALPIRASARQLARDWPLLCQPGVMPLPLHSLLLPLLL